MRQAANAPVAALARVAALTGVPFDKCGHRADTQRVNLKGTPRISRHLLQGKQRWRLPIGDNDSFQQPV